MKDVLLSVTLQVADAMTFCTFCTGTSYQCPRPEFECLLLGRWWWDSVSGLVWWATGSVTEEARWWWAPGSLLSLA